MQINNPRDPKALDHLAMHYRPGESALVVRLFQSLGLRVEDFGPSLDGLLVADTVSSPYLDRCYRIFMSDDPKASFFFVTTATQAQLKFEDALVAANLPALRDYKAARVLDPEASFHLGIRYDSLEDLERAVSLLNEAVDNDPDFARRVRIKRMKAWSTTDPSVGERMSASPAFETEDENSFAERVIQVFIETDLAAGSLLSVGQIIELDYIFPGPLDHYPPVKVYETL